MAPSPPRRFSLHRQQASPCCRGLPTAPQRRGNPHAEPPTGSRAQVGREPPARGDRHSAGVSGSMSTALRVSAGAGARGWEPTRASRTTRLGRVWQFPRYKQKLVARLYDTGQRGLHTCPMPPKRSNLPASYSLPRFPVSLPLWHVTVAEAILTWRWSKALNNNVHQGLHGEGLIYALACAAGFTSSRMNLDIDGVDWQIAYPGPKGTMRSPKIEFQVKSSSSPKLGGDIFQHRLKTTHFNHLAGSGFQLPRFLALVVVPKGASHYAICTNESMTLRTAAYWLSLKDQEQKPTGKGDLQSIVVEVPRKNLLTTQSLESLLAGDTEGASK